MNSIAHKQKSNSIEMNVALCTIIFLKSKFYFTKIAILFTFFFLGNSQMYAEWTWMNPLPQGNDIRDIWGIGPNFAVAVCGGGVVMHWNGSTWSVAQLPKHRTLHGVWGVTTNDIIAVGEDGTILHWDGSCWLEMISPFASDLIDIWGTACNDIYAVASDGMIIHWNGTEWVEFTTNFSAKLEAIWGTSSDDIFVAGSIQSSYKCTGIYHWDGTNWTLQYEYGSGFSCLFNLEKIRAIWGIDSGAAIAVGTMGMMVWDGHSWTHQENGINNLMCVYGFSSGPIFVGGSTGRIYYFNGVNWTETPTGTTENIYTIWGNSPNQVFAAGTAGILLVWTGSQWIPLSTGTRRSLAGVFQVDANNIFAVGEKGTILCWNTQKWTEMQSGTISDLKSVWGTSSENMYSVGTQGIILHWDGKVWAEMVSGVEDDLNDIWGLSADHVYAVGREVLRWNGIMWTRMPDPPGEGNDIVGFNENDLYIAGGRENHSPGRGYIGHWNGTAWEVVYDDNQNALYEIFCRDDRDFYAVGTYAWFGLGGQIIHWDRSEWNRYSDRTRLFTIWGNSSDNIYAAGDHGYILQWDGIALYEMDSWVDKELRCLTGDAAGNIYVVGDKGSILYYPAMATPNPTQSPISPATNTPFSTWTITPSPTQSPQTGAYLTLNSSLFHPGDWFVLNVTAVNNTAVKLQSNLFVFLDLGFDNYWFWPTWVHYPPDLDFLSIKIDEFDSRIFSLLAFTWPNMSTPVHNVAIWAGMTDLQNTDSLGHIDRIDFSCAPN